MDEYISENNPDELVYILNPTSNDFSLAVVDIHMKDEAILYTVKARESLQLPRYAAEHVAERLVQKMENKLSGVLTQAQHQQLLKQVRMYEVKEP